MAPNNDGEIKPTGSVHLSLQGKGGVGKSLIASILAQYLGRRSPMVRCVDSDPVNKTLAQYKSLRADPLPLLREGSVDQRAFDELMEQLLTIEGVFVVDNGASTFISPVELHPRKQRSRDAARCWQEALRAHRHHRRPSARRHP
jgi:cellulose biosynthesis protein BcsQ